MEVSIGDAREYVYYKDEILSELIWDMKPMTSIGVAADVGWKRGPQISADFSAGIPAETGSMQDSDWLNLLSNGTTYKTTYSKHDAALEFAIQACFSAGWEFPFPVKGPASDENVSVTPYLGFRYMTWKWNANDGYLQHTDPTGTAPNGKSIYPAWSDSMTKVPASGTVISYRQEYWMPLAGCKIGIPVYSRFRIDAECAGTFLVFCHGLDYHYYATSITPFWNYTNATQKDQYLDMLENGWMIEPKATCSWLQSRQLSLFIEGRWTLIGGLRGDTRILQSGATSTSIDSESSGGGGGAALNLFSMKLGATLKIR